MEVIILSHIIVIRKKFIWNIFCLKTQMGMYLKSDVFKEFGLGVDDPRLISSIGNLALVEKSINMSLGNKPFSQKRRIYPKSRYLLTRIISERPDIGDTAIDRAVLHMHPFDKWDKNSIHQRAEWLADLACAVWDVPIDDYGKGLEMEGR
ncbi:HNH endonuclease family protein [Bombella apis]|uniref:HNH endonuclease family protein n=1 Tax=Bombella apis TaxID=1785988 RepID=UPI0024A96916|nr:HNH endonuclease family protein [Bombella apis]